MILGDQYSSHDLMPATLPVKRVAIDTETTGLYPWKGDKVFCLSIIFPDGKSIYWHKNDNPGTRHAVEEVLKDPTIHKVMQNAIFDVRMLEYSNWPTIRGPVWDTMIFGHLLDGRDARGGLNLASLCQKYLPVGFRKVKKEIDEWFESKGMKDKSDLDFSLLPGWLIKKRVESDAELTLMLFDKMYSTVRKLFSYILWMEHRLLRTLYKMEDNGIHVDLNEVGRQEEYFTEITLDIEDMLRDYMGDDCFSITGRSDLLSIATKAGIIAYLEKIPNVRRGKLGVKLDAENLRMTKHPVAYLVLAARAAAKMRDTFLSQALKYNVNGIIHPGWKQCGTLSGRFSCVRPAMQTIPKDADSNPGLTPEETQDMFEMVGVNVEQHVKRIIIAKEGYAIMFSDKAQAEMCVLAHYSNDPILTEIVKSGENIHTGLCQRLYHQVTDGLRTRIKAVVFGFVYGAGLSTTARKIGEGENVARETRDKLGLMVPGLKTWNNSLKRDVNLRGYVETIHGRRHYLHRREEYMAVNRMCQGTIGDEVKTRMISIDDYIEQMDVDGSVLMNIHDDVATQLAHHEIFKHMPEIYRIMQETSFEFNVPLPSDCGITYGSWADKMKVKDVMDLNAYSYETWKGTLKR